MFSTTFMPRVDAPEILDNESCPADERAVAMRDLDRVNRWFGGVATSYRLLKRVARRNARSHLSLLEVGAGTGQVPQLVAEKLAHDGVHLDFKLLDRMRSHLPRGRGSVVADALSLPFSDGSFDIVSCTLFAHHLDDAQLAGFLQEGLRVSRCGVLINDLIRHPVHLLLVYAGFVVIHSRVAWLDGLASVRRAYVPREIREIIRSGFPSAMLPPFDISRHYLFRMGVIVWKISESELMGAKCVANSA